MQLGLSVSAPKLERLILAHIKPKDAIINLKDSRDAVLITSHGQECFVRFSWGFFGLRCFPDLWGNFFRKFFLGEFFNANCMECAFRRLRNKLRAKSNADSHPLLNDKKTKRCPNFGRVCRRAYDIAPYVMIDVRHVIGNPNHRSVDLFSSHNE